MILKCEKPFTVWKMLIESYEKNKDEFPLIIETDLKKLDDKLKNIYQKYFDWHFRDSMRSFLTDSIWNPKFEFSYYRRMHTAFSVDQIEEVKKKILTDPRKAVISIWSPSIDLYGDIIPCFMNLYVKKYKDDLNFVVVFRSRDIVKRLIPNWYALKIIQENMSKDLSMNVGNIIDISINYFTLFDKLQTAKDIIKEYESNG